MIVLAFVIWINGADKVTEEFGVQFTSVMQCTTVGEREALKKMKEFEARGVEATVHFTCGPHVEERRV